MRSSPLAVISIREATEPSERLHRQRAVAIVLTPCDSRAVGPAIREANVAGIPVFTADIACLDPSGEGGLAP